MITYLTKQFIAEARDSARTLTVDERELTIRHTTMRSGPYAAELEVLEGTSVIGYITADSDDEHGAIAAHLYGRIAPVLFRELDPALRRILEEQPER